MRMSFTAAVLQELEQEGKTTRKVLERVPEDRLTWKPHPKSMSLGQLALHIASAPAVTSGWALEDTTEFSKVGGPTPEPGTTAQILAAHDESMQRTKAALQTIGDDGIRGSWEARFNGATLMAMPKAAFIRALVMNHWVHHRGQLSVYLRLLDVPVPSIYGPSADESPFEVARAGQ
jgi:uncharacterized damage-inducible protein DinB